MTVMSVMEALGDRGMDALYTIPASASVAEAVEEMGKHDIGALVVSTEDRLLAGIFTERDVMMRGGGLSQLLGGGAAPEAPETPVGEGDAPEPTPAPAPQPATPASTCPDGMRPIEGMRVCIDEAESPGLGEIPQTGVDLAAARAGCAERHARLCTPAQWRAACRGPKSWRHPYGARAEIDRCNGAAPSGAVQDLSRAGARDRCVTPSGVFDLEGNVAEWVDDGSVLGGDSTTRSPSCDSRSRPADGAGSPSIGYRCCLDLAADHR